MNENTNRDFIVLGKSQRKKLRKNTHLEKQDIALNQQKDNDSWLWEFGWQILSSSKWNEIIII